MGSTGPRSLRPSVKSKERRSENLASGLPAAFALAPAQAEEWRRRLTALVRQPPINFEQAVRTAEQFLGPVLDGRARGQRWSSTWGRW